ncbi:hypothetical protein ALC56_01098, partial [Trachymyrmex septentrionalis]
LASSPFHYHSSQDHAFHSSETKIGEPIAKRERERERENKNERIKEGGKERTTCITIVSISVKSLNRARCARSEQYSKFHFALSQAEVNVSEREKKGLRGKHKNFKMLRYTVKSPSEWTRIEESPMKKGLLSRGGGGDGGSLFMVVSS